MFKNITIEDLNRMCDFMLFAMKEDCIISIDASVSYPGQADILLMAEAFDAICKQYGQQAILTNDSGRSSFYEVKIGSITFKKIVLKY